MSGGDLRKTVSVWPDMPAVSQRAREWQSLRDAQRGVAESEPVMLARHPDIATKNRAGTHDGGMHEPRTRRSVVSSSPWWTETYCVRLRCAEWGSMAVGGFL